MRSIKVTSSAFPGERAPSRHCLGKGGWGGGGSRRWAVGTRATAGAPGNEKGSSTCMRQTPNLLALREPKTEDAQARTKGGEKTRALHTNTRTPHIHHTLYLHAHIQIHVVWTCHTHVHTHSHPPRILHEHTAHMAHTHRQAVCPAVICFQSFIFYGK